MRIVITDEPCQHQRLAYGPTTGQVSCWDCNEMWWPWRDLNAVPKVVKNYWLLFAQQEFKAIVALVRSGDTDALATYMESGDQEARDGR